MLFRSGAQGPVGEKGEQGPKGDDGTSIKILGTVPDITYLRFNHMNNSEPGDSYLTEDTGEVWTFSPNKQFVNLGPIRGPQGEQGPQGPAGKDADPADLTGYATEEYVNNVLGDIEDLLGGI